MPSLDWNEQLENGLARMDDTHREFVELYNVVAAAAPEDFLAAYDAFVAHTEAHFAQENRWMEAVDFPGCHRAEHERVLAVLHDIRKRVANGDMFFAKRLIQELPAWFENHTNGMDAALAFHLNSVGYDVETACFAPGGEDDAKSSAGCACATLTADNKAACA
ncbi:hemerythrin domain-containing protein [Thauera linaloolentis]|uniref:Cation-binding hemerythrin HHE family protein n=1 Tax=Thauera linaloolentis (strain DSM 12138 / JCM 21573 / CCUG 41526 / CIP 105981 / IAM 15112 / NBRC 102519 / 47Lol) TaxID=1123367 RepID=N6Z7M2_THAL4|nr:hemerythrin domain-containing protein [Thauera linaloolentis]ENO90328.1 cation-binding hemerythrin HHE family protein [Thauera linaloolentis 47Lol = DSM 12138]MCM8564099.1 hemerythrin domain-containing protein [Thauera linaloolentis]